MKKVTTYLFLVFVFSLLLCACGKSEGSVVYNGRELTEQEIYELMCRETETEADLSEQQLVAFDGGMVLPTENCVYWSESGDVFHWSSACRYLASKKTYYGTVEDAVSCGKLRACSVCEKE